MLKLTNLGGMGMAAAGLGKSNLEKPQQLCWFRAYDKLHAAWGHPKVMLCLEAF